MSLKIFAKYTLLYSIGNIAVRLSTFLLIPLYTHYLSVSDYGLLSTMLLTTQLLVMLIDFGMMPSLIRFSNEYEKQNKTGELLGSSILINAITAIIFGIIFIYLLKSILEISFNIPSGFNYSLLIILSSIFQCFSLNLLSHFRAINKARFFIIVSISQTIAYLFITIFFVININMGIEGILLAQIIAYGLFWIFLLLVIMRYNKLKPSNDTLLKLIKFGFPLIFARGGDLILDSFILYTLGYFSSLKQVGIYSLSTKIASILLVLLIVPFQLSYEPYIYSQLEEKDLPQRISKIFTYLIFTFILSSVILLSMFKFLITIVAPQEYYYSYFLIFFIIPIYAFRGINSISQALIHINKKSNITGSVVLITTAVALFLSYFLIKIFGIYAAICISNLYWFSIAIILFYFGQKYYPIKLEYKRLSFLVLVYILFNIIIFNLSYLNYSIFYLIIIALIILTSYLIKLFNFFDNQEIKFFSSSLNKIVSFVKSV